MVSLWFSYGFPMVFPWFPYEKWQMTPRLSLESENEDLAKRMATQETTENGSMSNSHGFGGRNIWGKGSHIDASSFSDELPDKHGTSPSFIGKSTINIIGMCHFSPFFIAILGHQRSPQAQVATDQAWENAVLAYGSESETCCRCDGCFFSQSPAWYHGEND